MNPVYDPATAAAALQQLGFTGDALVGWMQIYNVLNDRDNPEYQDFKDEDGLMNLARLAQAYLPNLVQGDYVNFVGAPLGIQGVPPETWAMTRSYPNGDIGGYMNLTNAVLSQTGCDFSGGAYRSAIVVTDISGCTFGNASFPYASFKSANASSVSFDGTDLSHADFSYSQITTGSFIKALLDYSHFEGSAISARFDAASMKEINFYQAHIRSSSFNGANIPSANFSQTTFDVDASNTVSSFQSTDLTETSFAMASLTRVNFHGAGLSEVKLYDANLNGVSFSDNHFRNTVFDRTIIKRYNLLPSVFNSCYGEGSFVQTQFQALTTIGGCSLKGNFTGSSFSQMGMVDFVLHNSILTAAQFYQCVFSTSDELLPWYNITAPGVRFLQTDMSNMGLYDSDFNHAVIDRQGISFVQLPSQARNVDFSNAFFSLNYELTSTSELQGCDFSGATFNSSSISQTDFSHNLLNQTRANDLSFSSSNLHDNEFVDVVFADFTLSSSQFANNTVTDSSFSHINIIESDFTDNAFNKVTFEGGSIASSTMEDDVWSQSRWEALDITTTELNTTRMSDMFIGDSTIMDTALPELTHWQGENTFDNDDLVRVTLGDQPCETTLEVLESSSVFTLQNTTVSCVQPTTTTTSSTTITSIVPTTTQFNFTNSTNHHSPLVGAQLVLYILLGILVTGLVMAVPLVGYMLWRRFHPQNPALIVDLEQPPIDINGELQVNGNEVNEQTPLLPSSPPPAGLITSATNVIAEHSDSDSDSENDSSATEPEFSDDDNDAYRSLHTTASSSYAASTLATPVVKARALEAEIDTQDDFFGPEFEQEETWFEQCCKHFPGILFPKNSSDIDFKALYAEAEREAYFHIDPKKLGARESAFRNAKRSHFDDNAETQALIFNNIYRQLTERENVAPHYSVSYYVMKNRHPALLAYLYEHALLKAFRGQEHITADAKRWTRVHFAAYYNQVAALQHLISNESATNLLGERNDQGKEPALLAAEQGHHEVLNYLALQGWLTINERLYRVGLQSPNAVDFYQQIKPQPIWLANSDELGQTLLHLIVRAGETRLIKRFYSLLEIRDKGSRSPLMHAMMGQQIRAAIALLELGTKTPMDAAHDTLLHYAARYDMPEMMVYLQQHHAPLFRELVASRNKRGQSPFRVAVEWNSARAVAWLVTYAAVGEHELNHYLEVAYQGYALRSAIELMAVGARLPSTRERDFLGGVAGNLLEQNLPRQLNDTYAFALLYVNKILASESPSRPNMHQQIRKGLTETRFDNMRWPENVTDARKKEQWQVFEYILTQYDKKDVRHDCFSALVFLLQHTHPDNLKHILKFLRNEPYREKPVMVLMQSLMLAFQVSLMRQSHAKPQNPGLGVCAFFQPVKAEVSSSRRGYDPSQSSSSSAPLWGSSSPGASS